MWIKEFFVALMMTLHHHVKRSDKAQLISNFLLPQAHIWAQCNKTLYRSKLLPFHGNTIILCYKAILPWITME